MNRPLRVLLVEDSPDDAELVMRHLSRGGFTVDHVQVEERDAFVSQLARGGWDIVISDYALPRFSGMEALGTLRATGSELPFILVSGTVGEDVAVAAIRAGAQDYLLKDRLARLVPAVERELRENEVRSERRRAEVSLRENERRHRLLVESVGAIPWESTVDGRILYIGPQAERLLGYPMGRWYEEGFWRRTVHPDDVDRVLAILAGALERGQRAESRYRFRHLDGTWRWFLDIAVPGASESGERVMRGFLVDVTQAIEAEERQKLAEDERRRLEQQLQHTQKLEAIGTLAGGIAHDFNNILTAVNGNAHLLQPHVDGADGERYLAGILGAARRAQELVRQILAFSRRQEPRTRAMQIEDVVEEAASLLRATIPTTIRLDCRIAPNLPAVLADPGQIHQVVMNLGTNAFHAMHPKGGVLGIAVSEVLEKGSRWIAIDVSDSGTGMSPEVRARIFEPFFTTKPVGQGTGLGLSVVHGIVQAHQGSLTVDSEPGRGSRFRVLLPAIATASMPAPKPAEGPALGAGQEILLVDDEKVIRDLGVDLLDLLGYRGTSAEGPEHALELVRADPRRFAVVLTDLTMPGMTGTELALRLAEVAPRLPIVLCSGDLHVVESGKPHPGVRGLLAKPYTLDSLAAVLKSALVPKG